MINIINEMSDTGIAIIAASVLFTFTVLICALRKRGKNKKAAQADQAVQAATEFRNKVLGELKGLYPIPLDLKPELLGKFRGSIPQIESAAAQFRPFVPDESRKYFDNALKKYCVHCEKITLADCIASNLAPGKGKPKELEAKEVFRRNVNDLMSFTKENK